jgi:hypothetical protein
MNLSQKKGPGASSAELFPVVAKCAPLTKLPHHTNHEHKPPSFMTRIYVKERRNIEKTLFVLASPFFFVIA